MTYFMCMAIPQSNSRVRNYFVAPLLIEDADNSAFGKELKSKVHGTRTYFVHANGCATDILDNSERQVHCSHLFMDALRDLCEDVEQIAVAIHWFRGSIHDEAVLLTDACEVSLDVFASKFPNIQDNFVYTIGNQTPRSQFKK